MIPTSLYSPEPARGWLPWGVMAPVLLIVFVAGPLLGVSLVLEHFQLADAKGDWIGLDGLCAFLLFPFAAIGLLVLAWVRLIERRPLSSIGLVGTDRTKQFLRGGLVGCATILVVVVTAWAVGGFRADAYASAVHSPATLLVMALLLPCFAVQSSVEEIIFRGWLLSVLARKFNVAIALAVSSLTFALLHYAPQQPWLVTVNMFLFAAFAGCWALRAGNIWGVMGWHAGWNWLLAIGFELPVTGIDAGLPALLVKLSAIGPDYLTGGSDGPEGSVLCSLFFASAITVLRCRPAQARGCE